MNLGMLWIRLALWQLPLIFRTNHSFFRASFLVSSDFQKYYIKNSVKDPGKENINLLIINLIAIVYRIERVQQSKVEKVLKKTLPNISEIFGSTFEAFSLKKWRKSWDTLILDNT